MPINRFDISSLKIALDTHVTILVPNHRTREAILDSYGADCAANSWYTPQVYAIDVWLKQLWQSAASQGISPFTDYQLLESIEEHFIWTSIIEKSLDTIPLLNPDETATEVSQAYQNLRQWLPDKSANEKLESYKGLPDIDVFLSWKKQYLAYCYKKHLISLVDCTHKLITEIETVQALLPREIVIASFHQPPPLYQLLFATLQQQVTVHSILGNSNKSVRHLSKFKFNDFDSEVTACANWAKALMESEPESHIGILFNGDDSRRARLTRLFTDILYPDSLLNLSNDIHVFNTTAANQGLMDSALVHDAFQLLDLNHQQQQSNKLCRLLQSPHCIGFEQEIEARIQLELFMRNNFSATCTLAEFVRSMSRDGKNTQCPQLASALLKTRTLLRASPKFNTTANWAKIFTEQLDSLGWPGNTHALTPKEKSLVLQFQKAIEQFSHTSIAVDKLNLESALSRLRSLCSKTKQRLRFERGCQLSLYTINEAVGLNFDHVWLIGLDDQSWPVNAAPTSFLPYSLQREAGIPSSHSEIQYQVALANFDHLTSSVSNSLIASYPISDGDQQLRPSPFIAEFSAQTSPQVAIKPLNNYASQLLGTQKLDQILDCVQFPLIEKENPRGGQSIISNQSSCPFRAFARHRLHAEPLEEFESGLGTKARGTAIHLAMEHVYNTIDSRKTLTELSDEKLNNLIDQAASVAIDYLCRKHRELMTPRFQEIEQQRVESLLFRFIELEKQRFDYTVLATEKIYQWQLGQLDLKLKVDRIDTLSDGSLALIDYKTGKTAASTQRLLEDRPEDMQLPVYYSVVASQQSTPINTVQIAHINVEKIAYSGITATSDFHHASKPFNHDGKNKIDWAELTQSWQRKTELIAKEFVNGVASVAPLNRPGTCQYCGLQALCRVAELDLLLDMPGDREDEA